MSEATSVAKQDVTAPYALCVPCVWLPTTHDAESSKPFFVADDAEKCRELISRFETASPEQCRELAKWLAPVVRRFSLSREGCRVVQKAIEMTGGVDRDRIVTNLEPHIMELNESPHGNHVVAKMVEIMPPTAIGFVIDAIRNNTVLTARHRFGCRILERLIEHCSEQQLLVLLDEIVAHAETLCRHPYGNFFVSHLLEHGSQNRRIGIIQQLLKTLPQLAVHRTASHVVQRAIDHSNDDVKQDLITTLLQAESPHSLVEVASSRYGSFVVEQLASVGVGQEEVRQSLVRGVDSLATSPFGKRVIDSFGLGNGTAAVIGDALDSTQH